MNKITEQDLVLYHYGELSGDESKAIRLLINSDQQLSAQYKELSLLLGAADEWKPANVAENFEQKIWKSVNKEIEASGNKLQVQRSSVSLWQRVSGWLLSGLYHPAPVLALVVVLVSVAYFTGRYDQHRLILLTYELHFFVTHHYCCQVPESQSFDGLLESLFG